MSNIVSRRSFIKGVLASSCLATRPILAKEDKGNDKISVEMIGDLDDDLFVMKANNNCWHFEDCFQMHNPTNNFSLDGVCTESQGCPGYIDYKKTHELKNDEVLFLALANEREERDPTKALLYRTHYKSVELKCNDKVLIPRMIPELNDLPDAPRWYDTTGNIYNYFKFWENAIVNIGLVFPKEEKASIILANKIGKVVCTTDFIPLKSPQNIKFTKNYNGVNIGYHELCEIDGSVFGVKNKNYKKPNDKFIRKNTPYYALVCTQSLGYIKIPFPYPFPYINRIFVMSV